MLPEDDGITLKDVIDDQTEHNWRYLDEFKEKTQRRILRNTRQLDGKAVTLCTGSRSMGANGATILNEGDVYRMLSVTEMERLQTLPDGYTNAIDVCKTDRVKCLGNAFTAEAIAHILEGTKNAQ